MGKPDKWGSTQGRVLLGQHGVPAGGGGSLGLLEGPWPLPAVPAAVLGVLPFDAGRGSLSPSQIETRGDCYIVVAGCNSVEGDLSRSARSDEGDIGRWALS
jgi:hypothetical protein